MEKVEEYSIEMSFSCMWAVMTDFLRSPRHVPAITCVYVCVINFFSFTLQKWYYMVR